MESKFLPDKDINTPPVQIKIYEWEDLRRARNAGRYPWTYLMKPPLQGEITAEDIIRETTPRRSMSRDVSRSRTHSPEHDMQKILNLDSSPGSSRKHGDEGEDEGVQIPNFSKEVSLDNDDNIIDQTLMSCSLKRPDNIQLATPIEIPRNVSPKSILKRRTPETQCVTVSETREKTKCCHPLVNKIKHLADKTLHKLEKHDNEKSPLAKRKKNEDSQEIRELKSSPGAIRRQKFGAIKLGDSDEMSKTISIDYDPLLKTKKEHIYEDIEEPKPQDVGKCLQFSPEINNDKEMNILENESYIEKKSIASQDPSLCIEDNIELKPEEHIMEKLHKMSDISKEALVLDGDSEEPNIDEIFENQLEEQESDSPNITITEIVDVNINENIDDSINSHAHHISGEGQSNDLNMEIGNWSKPNSNMSKLRRWTSEGGAPLEKAVRPSREGSVQSYTPYVQCACQFFQSDSLLPDRLNPVGTRPNSRISYLASNKSDHEDTSADKLPPTIVYSPPSLDQKHSQEQRDEDCIDSLERKYLRYSPNEADQFDESELDEIKHENDQVAQTLQKDIEDRYFVSTPSTISRTECEISTSQVDSSALENLPLKRENRSKHPDSSESKLQLRFRESTGKLKSQAGKIKTKIQNLKSKSFSLPEKSKIKFPDKPKFKMPEAPKLLFRDRPKFTLPDRRKFSLPDRPKFKKINISGKMSFSDRKKFSFPERPKFNVPDLSKFKFPERPKVNFPSFSRKRSTKIDDEETDSNTITKHTTTVEYETKTYPRIFKRKKKVETITSSSPTLNREDTPPPTFAFTSSYKNSKSYRPDSPAEPREYGYIDCQSIDEDDCDGRGQYTTYDFDKIDDSYINNKDEHIHDTLDDHHNTVSTPDISPPNQEYTHVINEIDNDEFFVRPRGISRENIQVREYLSDEIRQAFKIPKNALALMGSNTLDNNEILYANDVDADPELLDENESIRYSNEDMNERDDGYYTFPPIRPSRAKRKKKEIGSIQYIDDSINTSVQFSDVDLEDQCEEINDIEDNQICPENITHEKEFYPDSFCSPDFDDKLEIQSQTLPAPPKRKKKYDKKIYYHSSLNDFRDIDDNKEYIEPQEHAENIIVYRTEHEYTVPEADNFIPQHSPVAPRRSRNQSRSSHGTSFCDDDRTSQGADSLTLDTHLPATDDIDIVKDIRHDSPGYATVDKSGYIISKAEPQTKTPPSRRRKSNSSDRKYYTVGAIKEITPNPPPRKKSSTSMVTLDSIAKQSMSSDITQYVEIDNLQLVEAHKDLKSNDIISKMKDRPLPPPPRPPRGSRRKSSVKGHQNHDNVEHVITQNVNEIECGFETEEIEVSTQTDALPDDVDFELGLEDNLDVSISSSLRDIAEGDSLSKLTTKLMDSPRHSRPVSRCDKTSKMSDPKIAELSKTSIGRTSPTVILVERRVSSPTRINEHEEIVTEASLTVQHIDIDESIIPEVPPLPRSRGLRSAGRNSHHLSQSPENKALEKMCDGGKDFQLDNLVTQRLQVKDLDVGRLNVSELQASKILVSEIEGMTLQVTELDSKSGHISVSGIEFSQTIIDEIVKKFAELTTPSISIPETTSDLNRPLSREEETQTEGDVRYNGTNEIQNKTTNPLIEQPESSAKAPTPPPRPVEDESLIPPVRPPPPDLGQFMYSYLQDLSMPPASFYNLGTTRERPVSEFHESQQTTMTTRRSKRKPAPQIHSSSDESCPRPSPRRMPPPVKINEQTITEAGTQFLRVCQSSISRTLRNMYNSLLSYISGNEDKKDVQMALVIFLVLIAGLIMFGLSDSRTIHHHHWEFFNPPDSKQ